ncbi:MAG: methyl-accepting chemotaxis protein [Treponema sp.]|jgi:methyl-accepting chemotaxis protein|nr:methyl-accepting chemotaxis protein [Treponema sp.]
MKNSEVPVLRGMGPYLFILLFSAALILGLSFIQLLLAGGGDPGRLRLVILGGGLVKTLTALLGMGILLWRLGRLFRKADLLKRMVRPLEEKDLRALAEIPEADPGTGLSELRDSLAVLGTLFERLRSLIGECAVRKKELGSKSAEEKVIAEHLGDIIEGVTRQCLEIEEAANRAGEDLNGIGDSLNFLRDETGEQARFMEQAGKDLNEAVSVTGTVVSRLKESSGTAKTLEEKVSEEESRVFEVNDIIKNISGDVEKIAGFAGLINQISEQTNLLSMNAAIESAHAGAAGAGFAVVADEIKKLAESTRENARRIQEELAEIAVKTKNALNASERSSLGFGEITGEMRRFTGGLKGIAEAAEKSRVLNGNIERAAGEQAENRRRMDRESGDIADRCRRFEKALELIRSLTDKTRTEVREIYLGLREILEKIRMNHADFFDGFVNSRELRTFFPGEGREFSGGKAPASPGAANLPPKINAADETPFQPEASAAKTAEGGLNKRGVAVKQAPRIIF